MLRTSLALGSCLAATTGGEQRMETLTDQHVAQNEFKLFGPYEVAAGSKLAVHMTGTGDAALYVKRNAEASLEGPAVRAPALPAAASTPSTAPSP
jgi:hypothetical protein